MAPTLIPTFMPTYMPTLADTTPSTLVLGMGVGTFIIIIFFVIHIIVWGLSQGCELKSKIFSRAISTLFFVIVFLILIFAPRESKDRSQEQFRTKIYDENIMPRIAIAVVIIFFGLVAGGICVKHLKDKKELTTSQNDYQTFWQDE